MCTDEAAAPKGPLVARLRARIARDGPLPVDGFMQACLEDAQGGYWHKRHSIGAGGDFITAPEISQVFGELIGVWSLAVWQGLGCPVPLRLIELGPGRGTLMADALRAAKAAPQFLAAASVHLIEKSEPLRKLQRRALPPRACVFWHASIAEVPQGPAIVIANEFLDALPIRQLVFAGGAWHERVGANDAAGGLCFRAGQSCADPSPMPARPAPGAICEWRIAEEELFAELGRRTEPLVALIIDYGPAESAFGDTLQAVRAHAYVDPLSSPGDADLSAHVHFAQLSHKAFAAGLAADGPLPQAEFLSRLGIGERASRLMAANPRRAGAIEAAVGRLLSPTGMGQLYKAIAVRSRDLSPPVGFA
jgi:SAM-dependent MidA family methyltransferase